MVHLLTALHRALRLLGAIEAALGFADAILGGVVEDPLEPALRPLAESAVFVGDAAFVTKGLDLAYAAIPRLCLPGLGGPLAQLVDDVGRRCEASGEEHLLFALGESLPGDLALTSSLGAGRRKLAEPLPLLAQPFAEHLLAFFRPRKHLAPRTPAEISDRFTASDGLRVFALAFCDPLLLALIYPFVPCLEA